MQTLAVGSSKNAWGILAVANGVEPEHWPWSRPTREIDGFCVRIRKK